MFSSFFPHFCLASSPACEAPMRRSEPTAEEVIVPPCAVLVIREKSGFGRERNPNRAIRFALWSFIQAFVFSSLSWRVCFVALILLLQAPNTPNIENKLLLKFKRFKRTVSRGDYQNKMLFVLFLNMAETINYINCV